MARVAALPTGRLPRRPAGFGAALHDLSAKMNRRERPISPKAAGWRFNFLQFRFFEIDRLARYRASAGIAYCESAFAKAVSACVEPNAAAHWVRRWAPTIGPDEFDKMIDEVSASRFLSASRLGNLLGLTRDERENLDFRTMRPAGMSPAEFGAMRRARKKDNDKAKATARRRAAGVPERKKGDAAAAEAAALGISRSTLFARRKAERRAADPEPDPNVAQGSNYIRDFRVQPSAKVRRLIAPQWLTQAFARAPHVTASDPSLPPSVARIGAMVSHNAAVMHERRAA